MPFFEVLDLAQVMQQFSILPKVINGGVASSIAAGIIYPMDLVKTRLQGQQVGPNGERTYNGIGDTFSKVFKREGLVGFYKGSTSYMIGASFEKGFKLAANDFLRYQLTQSDGTLPLLYQTIAGAGAGVCHIMLSTPVELLKIQMQDAGRIASAAKQAGETVEEVSTFKMLKALTKERGILGMYRGLAPTACRDIGFATIYFPMFSIVNSLGPRRPDGEAPTWVSVASGMLTGGFCAVAVTPFDVVKTRLQALKTAKGERTFTGIGDCFIQTYKYEGSKAFFKGGLCRILVIAPIYAIMQGIYYLGFAEYILGRERYVVK